MKWLLGLILVGSVACATPVGIITVINLGAQPLTGSLDGTAFTAPPGKAWSREAAAQGAHDLTIGQETMRVPVTAQRTTVIDPTGSHCYVVADYRRQYGKQSDEMVSIVEQFEKQKTFTPTHPLLVTFGRALPKQIPEGSSANRLHHVECALLSDQQKIAESIARIP